MEMNKALTDKRIAATSKTLHYKESSASSSGKVMDKDATESVDIPCTFTENTLTLNEFDNYTYSVEQIGKENTLYFQTIFRVNKMVY